MVCISLIFYLNFLKFGLKISLHLVGICLNVVRISSTFDLYIPKFSFYFLDCCTQGCGAMIFAVSFIMKFKDFANDFKKCLLKFVKIEMPKFESSIGWSPS